MTVSLPVHLSEQTIQNAPSVFDQLRAGAIAANELLSILDRYQLLPQLLRELIIDQAIADIACSAEQTIDAYKRFCEKNQINSHQDYQNWRVRHRLSTEQLQDLLTRELRVEKFKRRTWGDQLESYFLRRKGQIDRVTYSLIRSHDSALAQEIYFRIEDGEQSFAELAHQYSEGVEANTGGFIGATEFGTLHPVLAQKLAKSQPGQLLPPLRVNEWTVIARLEKLIPAQLDAFTEQRLLNELFESWLQEQLSLISSVVNLP